MNLGYDKTLFEHLTIQYLNVDIMHGNTLEIRFRQSIDSGRLQSFHLKLGRLLLEEALYAHNYGVFLTKMFSNLLTMLEVELTHKTLVDIEELTAYIKRHTNVTHNFISRIKIASLELDTQSHILYQDIQKLKKLSKLEFALLILLYDHQGEIVSHDEISKLWGGAVMENHSLYNLIAKLRKVLSVDTRIEIVTVGKDGYALKIEDIASCI